MAGTYFRYCKEGQNLTEGQQMPDLIIIETEYAKSRPKVTMPNFDEVKASFLIKKL